MAFEFRASAYPSASAGPGFHLVEKLRAFQCRRIAKRDAFVVLADFDELAADGQQVGRSQLREFINDLCGANGMNCQIQ